MYAPITFTISSLAHLCALPAFKRQCVQFSGLALSTLLLSACGNNAPEPSDINFNLSEMASFNEPWAMSFLPDGSLLISEKAGTLQHYHQDGRITEISAVPAVEYAGQGGFGDVVPHPDFSNNRLIYISYAEAQESGPVGAAVGRARLETNEDGGELQNLEVIWRQTPKLDGRGHYGHRLLFDSEGYLFISSGDRQAFDPAQDMNSNLGKIIRLHDDGRVPEDNPFADQGDIASQVWTLGHRNPLGLAFDADGQLWSTEMGPRGGDELNQIVKGDNYGYPEVSNGGHYNMRSIPNHDTRPEFHAPALSWTPVISPSSLMYYEGEKFPDWHGNFFIGGLSSMALIRVQINDSNDASEVARYALGKRIRDLAEGPNGDIWYLEDGQGGRLMKITPH